MAIPKFLKNMFGSDDIREVDFDDIDKPAATAVVQRKTDAKPADGEVPVELLDAILQVINAQLPPIAAECIDRDAQRRYLSEQLGEQLADYAETLREQRKEVTSKREEQKAALLSEQRQRRALSERNRDLEAKITELDSEIEQHKLTISSLMNKMRVAEVSEGDNEAVREQIEQLQKQLAERDAQLAGKDAEIAGKDAEIAELNEKLAQQESASAAVDAALEQRRELAGDSDKDEAAATPRKRRGRPRRQTPAYDPDNDTSAEIDSVDWLLPGGVPAGHANHVSDPDFGYQPPKQAPEPDPDTQLTLF